MRNFAKLCGMWLFAIVLTLLCMELRDLINPPSFDVGGVPAAAFKVYYDDSDDWAEAAFSMGLDPDSMSVYEFMAHTVPMTLEEAYDHREEYVKNH